MLLLFQVARGEQSLSINGSSTIKPYVDAMKLYPLTYLASAGKIPTCAQASGNERAEQLKTRMHRCEQGEAAFESASEGTTNDVHGIMSSASFQKYPIADVSRIEASCLGFASLLRRSGPAVSCTFFSCSRKCKSGGAGT